MLNHIIIWQEERSFTLLNNNLSPFHVTKPRSRAIIFIPNLSHNFSRTQTNFQTLSSLMSEIYL